MTPRRFLSTPHRFLRQKEKTLLANSGLLFCKRNPVHVTERAHGSAASSPEASRSRRLRAVWSNDMRVDFYFSPRVVPCVPNRPQIHICVSQSEKKGEEKWWSYFVIG